MKLIVTSCLLLCCLPAVASAGILGFERLTIDFTRADEAKQKATWSEPDKIDISKNGLGWDGEKNSSRDGWIQTQPLAVGLSWRPAQSVNVQVVIGPAPVTITLPNGQKFTPHGGSLYVRHSPDGKNWTSWQALSETRSNNGATAELSFSGRVAVPQREREEYQRFMSEYFKLDVPWKSDEEALVQWILKRDPEYFQKHKPFVGYVQFLWEGSFHGGQRITRFEASAGFGLSGLHSPPKDEKVYKDRNQPWRYRAP